MKQHQDACKRSDEVRVVDRAIKNREIKIKKVLCIQMTPHNKKFNRDIGLKFPGCWLSMLHVNHPPEILLFTMYYYREFYVS